MTAMTLGDMYPELNNCRPAKPAKKKGKDNMKGPGTALRLKSLYPEIESWDAFYITKIWMFWGENSGIDINEPVERDERFMNFLVNFIHEKLLEIESGIKAPERKMSGIDAAFMGIRQTYLENEKAEHVHSNRYGGEQQICP